ncbi:MAG: hypothetical protein J6035_06830 [Bacteroidaceae bacterium]|nr:hypothetical protein [Bacteroidaceae bacterium]
MKKNIFRWLSIFVMAAVCVGFASCGDDEEVKPLSIATNPDDNSSTENESSNGDEANGDSGETEIKGCPDNHHPHMIDLGLPRGTKWACCNVGANKPEEIGDYFAWGDVETSEGLANVGGYQQLAPVFTWETYKWCEILSNGTNRITIKKYGGTADNKTELDEVDDAAVFNWSGSWRMPNLIEMRELINNTIIKPTKENGILGMRFTSKVNNKSIFMPSGGYYDGGSKNNAKVDMSVYGGAYPYGYYWTSSRSETNYRYAHYLLIHFNLTTNFEYAKAETGTQSRYLGYNIRPVVR